MIKGKCQHGEFDLVDGCEKCIATRWPEVKSGNQCPLCEGELESLWGKGQDFHDWCPSCKHGWYVTDLKNVAANNLAFAVSNGRHGKSPEQIREVILAQDNKKTEEGK